jgi:manganese/iron transport system substrate-binding protein
MKTRPFLSLAALAIVLALSLAACGTPSAIPPQTGGISPTDDLLAFSPAILDIGDRLKVTATTSIVADVVQNIGGDLIDLTTLMAPGADPHSFEPTPQNMAAIADAHVVYASGVGLEAFLESLMESAEVKDRLVSVSYGIALLQFENAGSQGQQDEHQHEGADPHTWFDPNNVIVWVRNIKDTLSALDPANAERYQANAAAYMAQLEQLDTWIRQQVAQVPEANRKLVTDHTSFTYFAHRYGFEQVGAVFPGYSTLASPSAKELAALQDSIRTQGVKAVFVGKTVNPALSQRVAQDTGTRLVFVYTGSLGEAGSPGSTYLGMMEYNVSAIVDALR